MNIIFKAGNGGTGAAGGQFGGPGGIGGDIILKGSNSLSMDQFSSILKNERTISFNEIDASLVKDMRKQFLLCNLYCGVSTRHWNFFQNSYG